MIADPYGLAGMPVPVIIGSFRIRITQEMIDQAEERARAGREAFTSAMQDLSKRLEESNRRWAAYYIVNRLQSEQNEQLQQWVEQARTEALAP